VQSLGNGTAFSALAPSQRPAVAAHRSRNVRNQNPRTFATANIQFFRIVPPATVASWISPAVCSVCHSRRACDARYHITPNPHVNHVRLVILARTRRAFGTT